MPGTAFLAGGYNSTATGLPEAWAGNSPASPDVNDVEVDLSAYAGFGRRFRWRFLADTNAGIEGWWVDDVHFTNTSRARHLRPDRALPAGRRALLPHDDALPALRLAAGRDERAARLGAERAIAVVGAAACGIPATARAVAVNLTVVSPTAGGHVTVYSEPGDDAGDEHHQLQRRARRGRTTRSWHLDDLGRSSPGRSSPTAARCDLVVDVFGWFE